MIYEQMCLYQNGSCHGPFEKSYGPLENGHYAGVTVHSHLYHYSSTAHNHGTIYATQTPKLSIRTLQSLVRMEFSCLKCGKNLHQEPLNSEISHITYLGFLLGQQKMNPKCREILNQETSN